MRQVLQSLGSGEIEVVTAPAPLVRPQHVLIETRRTLISAGAERMLLKFGRFEIFAGRSHVRLGNFAKLDVKGWPRSRALSGRQDKGHTAALKAFMDSVRSGAASPIPLEELLEVSRWSIRAAQQSA